MSKKPWQLDRRTFLRGLGVTCALPYLECMTRTTWGASSLAQSTTPPKRLCFVYFPNGVGLPPKKSQAHEEWNWFPLGQGTDYRLTNTLAALEPYREKMSILGGLSHPNSRRLLGHLAGDTWLTAGDVRGSQYKNRISVDQKAAETLGKDTRFKSLCLSTDGGVGYKSRVSTLSFDANGKPIPSEHRQREIFERYFAPGDGATTQERRKSLEQRKKIVDLIHEDGKRLQRTVGKNDSEKIDEYLTSVNAIEEQVRRNKHWLDIPMKEFDADNLDFNVDAAIDPQAYIRATIDMMVLGFQTDMTRVMTYMMAREDGMGLGENFPNLALGIKKGHHTISHDKSKGHWQEWGSYDAWLASQFAYFLKRMSETSDEHGPLIDNTLMLYGSACSTTHNARNYPLVLAGGENLGVKHGSYTVFDEKETPMSNLFVSMLNAAGVHVDSFGDSTGKLPAVFS
jgi:hypothetical protein